MKIILLGENGSVHIQKWIRALADRADIEMHVITFDRGVKYDDVHYHYLKKYFRTVESFSYEERISKLNMNLDRADVILPALNIYISAMKWSGAKEIYVPKIGLSDGIIRSLYQNK